jgi:hypothetical protein
MGAAKDLRLALVRTALTGAPESEVLLLRCPDAVLVGGSTAGGGWVVEGRAGGTITMMSLLSAGRAAADLGRGIGSLGMGAERQKQPQGVLLMLCHVPGGAQTPIIGLHVHAACSQLEPTRRLTFLDRGLLDIARSLAQLGDKCWLQLTQEASSCIRGYLLIGQLDVAGF